MIYYFWEVILFGLGFLISGIVVAKKGRASAQQAETCPDPEERTALENLGRRRRTWGTVQIVLGAILAIFPLALVLYAAVA